MGEVDKMRSQPVTPPAFDWQAEPDLVLAFLCNFFCPTVTGIQSAKRDGGSVTSFVLSCDTGVFLPQRWRGYIEQSQLFP